MVCFLSRDDRRIGSQWEVDTWVGHQVGLEFCQVYIQGTIKAERGCDGRHNLANQTVEVGVGGALNVQVTAADIVDGFIVHHEGTIGVLKCGVSAQNGVVRLNYCRGDLRGWVDGKLQFGFLPIVHRETFKQKRGKSRAGAATKGVKDQETLKSRALVRLCEK